MFKYMWTTSENIVLITIFIVAFPQVSAEIDETMNIFCTIKINANFHITML